MTTAAKAKRWLRRSAAFLMAAGLVALVVASACDDEVAPEPPKSVNLPPESFLSVDADSIAPQFYKVPLRWLGSDADGTLIGFQYRWTCLGLGPGQIACPPDPGWIQTTATADTFVLQVPNGSARYRFELAAVDNDGVADPTPAMQEFDLYNNAPVAILEPGTEPVQTLPAVTFYLQATDPDSTPNQADHDSRGGLAQIRGWLDGNEAGARTAPFGSGSFTFFPTDFGTVVDGPRTAHLQVIDDGGAVSGTVQHTWQVLRPPDRGILLVDDCRMGGAIEDFSDTSYRNVLEANAAGRWVPLDVETVPRLSQADFEATLSLFDRVVWYTDSDTTSSGALELAKGGFDALLARAGHLYLCSGLAFGTSSVFGADETRFRDLFGIDTVFRGPDGSTNFVQSLEDTVRAAVQPSLTSFRFLHGGFQAILDCFRPRPEAATRGVYYYPPGTFVRTLEDSTFVNPERFDIGLVHQQTDGGGIAYLSFPLGIPINDVASGENEVEIRELLRQVGILDP